MGTSHALLVIALVVSAGCGTSAPVAPSTASSPSPGASPNGSTAPSATSSLATAAPSAEATAPADLKYLLTIPDEPVAVTATLDEARAVEALVATEGGQLSATAADGTTFELTIPNDALAAETLIRMTPLSTLEGMAFGTDPHAVQLEPAGLQFFEFVTLKITPPTDIPPDQQVLFGYDGIGDNVTLAVPAPESAEIALNLLHFSGAGVTSAVAAQVAAVQSGLGGTLASRITSAIAAELGRVRQAALMGQNLPVDQALIEALLDLYETHVVRPLVAAAGQSCAAATEAIQTVLGYERMRALLGFPGQTSGLDPALVDAATELCVREEYERCRDNHAIQNMIPTWLAWQRYHALYGGSAGSPVLATAEELVRKCLVFEMIFESQVNFDGGGTGWDSAVKSTFDMRFDTAALRFRFGPSPLDNFSFEFRSRGCQVTSTPGDGTFHAIDFNYVRDTRTPTDMVGYVRDLEFAYNPGGTNETFTIRCPGTPPIVTPPSGMWSGMFIGLHRNEGGEHDGKFSYIATDWDVFADAYYAKKEWIKSGQGATEAGTLKLYHTPE